MVQSPHLPRSRRTAVLLSDADLASRAAAGEVDAFDELYRRHAEAAWRVAQAVAHNTHDAADAVAEAFVHVFRALPGGRLTQGVPFRPYLLKATRNAAIDTLRRTQRVQPTPEVGDLDGAAPGAGPSEHVVIAEEVALVGGAFRGLPERWRSVLWLTEVEGMPAREVAAVLGMSPNAVAQLAKRARSGLRRNYLQAHVGNGVSKECKYTVDRLGAYVAGALPRREITKVERHLDGCELCAARLADLEDVGSTLRRFAAVPLPLALGAATAAKWHGAVGASASASRLAPSVMAKAVAAATVGVLGLGLGALFVGPHRTPSNPPLTAAAPIGAPQTQSVVLANAAPSAAQDGAPATGTAPSGHAQAGAPVVTAAHGQPSGTDPRTVDPAPPATPNPSTPSRTSPDPRAVPVLQATVSANFGAVSPGASAGVGQGACTTIVVLPSPSDCTVDRATVGVTVSVGSALLAAPVTLSLP
jgi:RNA polymerase sigma factor (sigma-70 family)